MLQKYVNKKILKIIFPLMGIVIFLLFGNLSRSVNQIYQKSVFTINGETLPDTNIILIEINSSDIKNLSGWPLKRSYYALLIENLNRLNVKKIGIEVFLSKNLSNQNIYNRVLVNSLRKHNNVILASIGDKLESEGDTWKSNNIDFPFVKDSVQNIKTGHINFLEDNNVVIPAQIIQDSIKEFSFAEMLVGDNSYYDLNINFTSSWEFYKKYSLLQFFNLVENNRIELNDFSNKIILIGVTDPLISKSIKTKFDESLPGLAIHAFAVDNLINRSGLNTEYSDLSVFIFFLIVILLSIYSFDKIKLLLSALPGFIIITYIFWSADFIQFNYSAFLIPYTILFIGSILFAFIKEQKGRIDSEKISTDLEKELRNKELQLIDLSKQLKNNTESDELNKKIDELKTEIENLRREEAEDNQEFQELVKAYNFEGIIYRSKKMQNVVNLIKKVAPENAAVLIQGESGSGKELVANAIHNLSKRNNKNIVVINCAALPENLLESELFGHVKGAFTDAKNDKIGRFEEADHSTLFLDEIGETTENFQVKLLRVLQTGDFQKVGSSQTLHSDVRIIAATNKDLQEMVKEKRFREDLFYRLNVINIELPSLNERREDIEILAKYFARKENSEMKISKAVMKKLVENDWKGNIRELESVIKRAVIFAGSESRTMIKLHDLPKELSKVDKNDLETMILESLREKEFSRSSINETAKELGDMNRTIISENFRGICFKHYVDLNFDFDKCVKFISKSDSDEINKKVSSKLNIYLSNLENDLNHHKSKSLDEIKIIFASKYKNLPHKFHEHLDKIILNILSNQPGKLFPGN